jgi:glucose-6-phosphate-specific signal transduction histidine kinase
VELLKRPWVFIASILVMVLIAAATRDVGYLLVLAVLVVVHLIVLATRGRRDWNLRGWVGYIGILAFSLFFIFTGIRYLRSGDETRYAVGVLFVLGFGWIVFKLLAPAWLATWKGRSTPRAAEGVPEGAPEPREVERHGKHEVG